MSIKRFIFILLLMLLYASPLLGRPPGMLIGRVSDAATGQPLPAVAIWLDELALGDISDTAGQFQIRNIRFGRYTLKATLIGYKAYTQYGVEIRGGDTIRIDFSLEETVLPLGEEQVVIGTEPLLDLNQPSTARSVSRQEIALSAPIEIRRIIEDQLGVSTLDNEIHIRGGRTYEGEFLVDRISVGDPLVRQGFALNLNPAIVDRVRVISGGLSAQYGGATSGIVEVFTREGGDRLAGGVKYRTDNFGFGSDFDYNTDIVDLEFSGPDPLGSRLLDAFGLGRRSYFFIAAGFAFSDTHLGYGRNLFSSFHGNTFAPRGDNSWTLFFKWHGWLRERLKLTMSYNGSVNINQNRALLETRFRDATYSYGYPFEYSKNLGGYNTFTQFTNQQIIRLETNPGIGSGWSLALSRLFTNLHSDVGGKRWDQYQAPLDTLPRIVEISPDSSYYTIVEGDGFYDSGDGDLWYDHYLETYGIALDFRFRKSINQNLFFGLSYDYQTLQMTDIFRPYLGDAGLGLNYDLYKVHPGSLAVYFQNRFNFSGAVFDLGARYDIWFPGKYAEDAALSGNSPIVGPEIKKLFENETFELFGRRARGVISPRLGVSYLLSNNLTLYLSYNRLAKKPPAQYVYARLFTPGQGAYQLFGNPALGYEKVTTLEAGIKYLPRPGRAISISAYWKDISDYIAATQFTPDTLFPDKSYLVHFNLDFASSRGMELGLIEDIGRFLRFFGDLSFSRAEGERSLPADILRGIESRAEGQLFAEVPFDWDIPWQFSLGANLSIPSDHYPKFLGLGLPSDWNLHIKYTARAGKRYTPYRAVVDTFGLTTYQVAGETNSRLGPYQSWLNLTLQKYFRLGSYRLTVSFEAQNLLNHKNVTIINPVTGKAYRHGETIPTGNNFFEIPPEGYKLPIWDNPAGYLEPRTLRLGVGVEF